jgi:hypothetical protein
MAFKPCRLIVVPTGLFLSGGSLSAGVVVSESNHRNSSDTRRPFCSTAHRAARNPPLSTAASHHTGVHMLSQLPRDAKRHAYRSMLCCPAFSDPGLASDVQESTQKPSLPLLLSPTGRQHIPGFGSSIFPISYHPIMLFLFFFVLYKPCNAAPITALSFKYVACPTPSLLFSYPHR